MIKAMSPTRVDLAGGTLDCWPIYLMVGNCSTVNLSIGIHTGVHLRPREEDQRVVLKVDSLDYFKTFSSLQEVLNCKDKELTLIIPHLDYWQPNLGFELSTFSDSPVGGGLGGSSSLCISLLKAFAQWSGRELSVNEMVTLASNIEAKILGTPTGTQDYFPAIVPGLNIIHYGVEGPRLQRVKQDLNQMYQHLVVVYTGQAHHSGINNWQVLKAAIEGDKKTLDCLKEIAGISAEMASVCMAGEWQRVSALFQREYQARTQLCDAFTSPEITHLEKISLEAGASSIKICGAGGGGSVLLWCEPNKKLAVEAACEQAGYRVLPLQSERNGWAGE